MGLLSVPAAAADARQAALAARQAVGAPELAAGAAADAGDAALAARTAVGAVVYASGTAGPVGVAAAAARVILEDQMRGRGAGHRWSNRKSVGRGRWCAGDRRSDGSGDHQWFDEIYLR